MRIIERRTRRCSGDESGGTCTESHPLARIGRCRRTWRLDLAYGVACARARHSDGAWRARCDPQNSRRRAMCRRWRCRCCAVAAVTAKPRVFVTQPIASSALDRLRAIANVKVNTDSSKIIAKSKLIAAVKKCDMLFSLLHDRIDRAVLAANPKLRAVCSMSITPDNIDVAEATRRGIPVTVVPPIVVEATSDIHLGLVLVVAGRLMEGKERVVGRKVR